MAFPYRGFLLLRSHRFGREAALQLLVKCVSEQPGEFETCKEGRHVSIVGKGMYKCKTSSFTYHERNAFFADSIARSISAFEALSTSASAFPVEGFMVLKVLPLPVAFWGLPS